MTHIQLRALQIMGPRATAEELNHAEQILTDRPEVLNLFDALFSLPADIQDLAITEILKRWGAEVAK